MTLHRPIRPTEKEHTPMNEAEADDTPTLANLDERITELEERVDLLTYRLDERGGEIV